MSKKFLIVDGNSIACRAAFAHNPKKGPELMNSAGHLTGATYRFFTMFDRIMHLIKPTHILVAWDVGSKTFRNDIDETYKANREKKNDELYTQFNDIKRILKVISIKYVGITGYEADDIIGTYANISEADKTYIMTGDRDSFQLVNDNTCVIYPLNGFKDVEFITPEYMLERYSIPVDKFIDLKALMGDGGDNVIGIDGCGEKTALKLLLHYGSVEEVAKNAGNIDIKGVNKKAKEGIIEWAPRSGKVKQLVTIKKDVGVPYDFDECEIDLKWENALPIFEELEFTSFIKKVNGGEFYNVIK